MHGEIAHPRAQLFDVQPELRRRPWPGVVVKEHVVPAAELHGEPQLPLVDAVRKRGRDVVDGRQPDLVPCEKHETDRYQRRGATDRFHTSLATIVPTVGRALVRISRAAARRRWAFVLAWVVLLVLALPFAGRAQSKLSNGGFEVPGAESERNLAYFEHLPRYGAQPFTLLVSAPTAEAAAARLADVHREALAVDDRIRFTTAPTASADGRTRAVTGYASVSQNEALAISRSWPIASR